MNSIDVVIPAYNEEKTIGACLTALTHQTYKGKYRIIVVDNNSTDNTKKIAQSFPGVLVKSEKRKGYVFAVKTGIEKYSTAPIIAQTDADSRVSNTWIQSIISTFEHDPRLSACGGPYYYHDGPLLLRAIVNIINFLFPRALNYLLCGMNMAYRKSAYHAVGGYDTKFNLQADAFLGKKLLAYGKVSFFRHQYVYTTSRRYATIKLFFHEVYFQSSNLMSLIFRNKPLYYSYSDIRN